MKRSLWLIWLLLSACATAPKQTQIINSDNNARMAYLASHHHWAFTGRLAYSHLGQGGSAKAIWQQNAQQTDLTLTSALNIGTLKMTVNDNLAQLISSDGQRRAGNPDVLMQEMLNMPVPFTTLLAGLRGDWLGYSNANIIWRDNLPYQVDIDGWRWQYQQWTTEPAVLPQKIELSQGKTHLRIIVDQWQELTNE